MIIDLCSGYGKWSKEVITIDFDKKVKPSIVADIRYLPLRPGLKPKLCHASPPCKYFSFARNNLPIDGVGLAESLEIVAACLRAFDYLEAKTWTIENPVGRLSHFLTHARIEYKVEDFPHKRTDFYSNNKSLRRAMIPQEVKNGLLSLANMGETEK